MTSHSEMERYQAFMIGYVNRINKATLNVTIGGIRIGTAKYSRLAQINLHTRIITFSKFAIENVPERGRRYLVIHELAHVNEANHTKRFWDMVARFEPDYKRIGHALDLAFKQNVKQNQRNERAVEATGAIPLLEQHNNWNDWAAPLFLAESLASSASQVLSAINQEDSAGDQFGCMEGEFDAWDGSSAGAIQGGSDADYDTIFSGARID